MKYPKQSDELLIYITPNSTQALNQCYLKRPCNRIKTCSRCWKKYRLFILKQARYFRVEWGLNIFVTITVLKTNQPSNGIKELNALRKTFNRRLTKKTKYLNVISIKIREGQEFEGYTELIGNVHFHYLMSNTMTKLEIKKMLNMKCNVNIRLADHEVGIQQAAGYMLDQNLRPTLDFRPQRARLITASRGFSTGKPRKLHFEAYAFTGEF